MNFSDRPVKYLYPVALLGSSVLVNQASAAVVTLVGGATGNGNFETTAAGGVDDGDRPFVETGSWVNLASTGNPQAQQATRNNPATLGSAGDYPGASGGYNAVVSEDNNRLFGNDSNHTVVTGDRFTVAYHWIDAFNWNDASDQIGLTFFTTTDDSIGGTIEDSIQFLSGVSTTSGAYQQYSQTDFSLPASFEGDRLFIEFRGVDGSGAANGFSRLDDFSLSVDTIPEPSSAIFLVLGGLGLLRRRGR